MMNAIRGMQTRNQSMLQFNWNLYLDQLVQSISITYVKSLLPNQITVLFVCLCFWQYFNLKLWNHRKCERYKFSMWLQVASFWQLMVPFPWRWKAAEVIMLSQRPNLWGRYFRQRIRKLSHFYPRWLVQVMNDIAIGEKKNMNLPGVKVDLPVLQDYTWICWVNLCWMQGIDVNVY